MCSEVPSSLDTSLLPCLLLTSPSMSVFLYSALNASSTLPPPYDLNHSQGLSDPTVDCSQTYVCRLDFSPGIQLLLGIFP